MGDKTGIEYVHSTWNTVYGCTKVSPACSYCFIEDTPAYRIRGLRFVRGRIPVQLLPDRLLGPSSPLRWRRPRRIFVNDLSDLYHEDVPATFIAQVYAVMSLASWHRFMVFTKRPERRLELLTNPTFVTRVAQYRVLLRHRSDFPAAAHTPDPEPFVWPLPHLMELVTAENQRMLDLRVPLLLETPAAMLGVSIEPLLGAVDLNATPPPASWIPVNGFIADDLRGCLPKWQTSPMRAKLQDGLDWVVVGGESGGPEYRRLVDDWRYKLREQDWRPKASALERVRSIRDQCIWTGVPFYFKQWGGPRSKSGGRLLDGRTWDELPEGMLL